MTIKKVSIADNQISCRASVDSQRLVFSFAASALSPAFRIQNWPTSSSDGDSELKRLVSKGTHRLRIPPVFTDQDEPILPTLYRSRMVGATVRVDFTLKHYHMAHRKTDNFIADVLEVKILRSPPKGLVKTVSPRKIMAKRTAGEAMGTASSGKPAKRTKINWYDQ